MISPIKVRKLRIGSNPRNSHVSASAPMGIEPLKYTRIPERFRRLEQTKPLTVVNDNPVFNDIDSASILGVSRDCMKKWRQRDQGPDYIQYGLNGPIRYAMKDLIGYRETHMVHLTIK